MLFNEHNTNKVVKSHSLFAKVKKGLLNITKNFLRTLHKGFVRKHLEYINQTWKTHRQKHESLVENIQRRATKVTPHLSGSSNKDVFKIVNIPTPEFRRCRRRMIEVLKLSRGSMIQRLLKFFYRVNEKDTTENPCKLKGEDSKIVLWKISPYLLPTQML